MLTRFWKSEFAHRVAKLAYHHWYYDTGVWQTTTYLGVPCLKSVSDMWNYQEILHQLRPRLLIEFGTHAGGATLFFSDVLKRIEADSKVLTVDVDHSLVPPHVRDNEHIEYLTISSVAESVASRIQKLRSTYTGPVFVILDSDHSKEHVFNEMLLLRPLLTAGDYLVVEDSNINGHPVLPCSGPGPMEAMEKYLRQFEDDYDRDVEREGKFGFTFAPRGFLIRKRAALRPAVDGTAPLRQTSRRRPDSAAA